MATLDPPDPTLPTPPPTPSNFHLKPTSNQNGHQLTETPLHVTFMAVASEFSMGSLYRRLLLCKEEYGGITISSIGSVICLAKLRPAHNYLAEAFVFPYGCMVVWGTDRDRDDFLSLIIEDAIDLRSVPAVDSMEYEYGRVGALRRDVITLQAERMAQDGNDELLDPVLERMAIACGLAQSIKLAAFESAMRTTIESTRHLPEEMANTGRISASRREVSRLMGQLFLDRYRFHLSGDLLMTPAFFWENEQYLPCYRRVERYLEVKERGDVLNKRVEVVQELYQLLGEELNNQNSAALELAITVMIAFEILLTLTTLARQSMRSVFSAFALFLGITALGWVLWRAYRRRRSWMREVKYRDSHNLWIW